MDWSEYRRRGKEMVDYIADYMENIRDRRVYPDVEPGFLQHALPEEAPEKRATWDSIMQEFEQFILPGVAHTQSPHMHAYSAIHSPAALLGDMLAGALNCLTFTWNMSPACTELDVVVTNWLGKMMGLPLQFLNTGESSTGGGMFQNTSSEALLVSLLSARKRAAMRHSSLDPVYLGTRLIAYCSDQTHANIKKGCQILQIQLHIIHSDDEYSLQGHHLKDAISRDREKGLIPFYMCATLGTTFACSFDNLKELGPICANENMWLHVDAAYAGTAFVCPEFRSWMAGIEHADSLTFLPCKIMLTNFYSCVMWAKDTSIIEKTLRVEQDYANNNKSGLEINLMASTVHKTKHRQLSFTRYFHSLKTWFMLKRTGVEGIQLYVRKCVQLCQLFVRWVCEDYRFEMCVPSRLGMAVFRLKGDNCLTEQLLARLNNVGEVYCSLATLRETSTIRFFIASQYTTEDDVWRDWSVIKQAATEILQQ